MIISVALVDPQCNLCVTKKELTRRSTKKTLSKYKENPDNCNNLLTSIYL